MKQTLNRLVILGLLLLFTFSQLYLILDTIGCSVDVLFPLWVIAVCVGNWLTTCAKRGLWIGLPLVALLLFAAYRYYQADVMLQLNDLFDKITGVYMERVAYPGDTYGYLNAASDHSLLFIFLAFLFSSYMSSAITAHSARLLLAMLGGLLFTLACIAVNLHPPVWTILGLSLFFFLLAASGDHYAEGSNAFRSVLCTLLPILFLLAALVLVVDPANYQYDPSQAKLSRQLSEITRAIDDWISERAEEIVLPHADWEPDEREDTEHVQPERAEPLWQDRTGGMDLTQDFNEQDLDRVFLRVRADHDGSLYLRSVSYGDYTGTGWSAAEDYGRGSSLPYTALAVAAGGAQAYELRVTSLDASPYRYLPYFCTQAESEDAYVSSGLLSTYSAVYTAFPASFDLLQLPAEISAEEQLYRSFAHDCYTRLPDSTRQTLTALCQQAGLRSDASNVISEVARYVQSSSVYDLETAPYPSGDYAVYFLTQSHHGYCVHFATAAAALYRSLGIPARVTEGFLVACEAGKTQDVTGADAHAWVEVYRDGLGWLPVEVTGQSGLNSDALGTGDRESTPPPQTAEQPADAEPFEAMPLDPEPAESTQMPVGLVTQALLEERDGGRAGAARGTPYCLLAVLVALLAALPLWRLLRRTLRLRSFEQHDTRRAIVAIYRTAESASAFGADIPEEIRHCAEKAVFSTHSVTLEEVESCRDQLYILLKSTYLRLGPWKKFRFKYLYAFL